MDFDRPFVRMNALILETGRGRDTKFGMKVSVYQTEIKFI